MEPRRAANIVPVIASNRIGRESSRDLEMTFYGSSLITDHRGSLVESADAKSETILTASFDLEEIREHRRAWGVFRDRRPDLYHPLLRLDGSQSVREPKS